VPSASILVVDDESIVRNTAKAILEHSGHSVVVVSSGQEALRRLHEPHQFSLVLLDLNMPGMDGKQTLHEIRHSEPDLPVVICSGYGDSEIRHRFEDVNVNGFLQKPFQSGALTQTVSELLRAR
jgi:CheY-like chemotaxis protein